MKAFVLVVLVALPLKAAIAPISSFVPVVTPEMVIAGGPGYQEHPHVSGNLVVFGDLAGPAPSTIRWSDLTAGMTHAVPQDGVSYDFARDVSGGRINDTDNDVLARSFALNRISADQQVNDLRTSIADVEADACIADAPNQARRWPSVTPRTQLRRFTSS